MTPMEAGSNSQAPTCAASPFDPCASASPWWSAVVVKMPRKDPPTGSARRGLVREADIINGDYHIHWLEQYLAGQPVDGKA